MVTYGWPATRGEWGSHLLCTGLGPKRGAAPSSPLFSPPLQSSCAQRKESCEGSQGTPFLSKGRRKTQLPSVFSRPNASEHEVFLRSAVKTPAQAGLVGRRETYLPGDTKQVVLETNKQSNKTKTRPRPTGEHLGPGVHLNRAEGGIILNPVS